MGPLHTLGRAWHFLTVIKHRGPTPATKPTPTHRPRGPNVSASVLGSVLTTGDNSPTLPGDGGYTHVLSRRWRNIPEQQKCSCDTRNAMDGPDCLVRVRARATATTYSTAPCPQKAQGRQTRGAQRSRCGGRGRGRGPGPVWTRRFLPGNENVLAQLRNRSGADLCTSSVWLVWSANDISTSYCVQNRFQDF